MLDRDFEVIRPNWKWSTGYAKNAFKKHRDLDGLITHSDQS